MKNTNNKYYLLLFVGICLLVFVFYFTYARYSIIKQIHGTAEKTNAVIDGYQELSDDYKSAIIYASHFRGRAATKYSSFYEADAKELLSDINLLRTSAEDSESTKRADSLKEQVSSQLEWILQTRISDTLVSGKVDTELNSILALQAIIDRGEMYERKRSGKYMAHLEDALSSIFRWLLILISASATLIIIVVISILRHMRRKQKHLQRIELQKLRLEEIAWIQSHKVRAQVATILGLAQLFNYNKSSDPINIEILEGVMECSEKLDKIIREIDSKTRVPE